jgi:protease I
MKLEGKRIAVLAENNYEPRELWCPLYRLREEGADVHVLGTGADSYESKNGLEVKVDKAVDDVEAGDYDGVVIPGGYAPDAMRRHGTLCDFVRTLYEDGKVVAYICHAGWVAASAGIVRGKRLTSFYSIRDDMVNAGAEWVDEPVVRDGNLISSRVPADLPEFNRTLVDALSA